MSADKPFTKENLDGYLRELAKEFRKKNGNKKIPEDSRVFIEAVYNKEDLHDFYRQCREIEQENKDTLVEFQEDYPGVLNDDNLADVLKAARAKKVMPDKRKNEIYKHFFEKRPVQSFDVDNFLKFQKNVQKNFQNGRQ